jgi:O-antigen ligase/cytochrome c-type biogenesis protein CcmH/NrfG
MEFIWLASALLVPLAFNPWGCNPFALPKASLLRALVLLLGLMALVRGLESGGLASLRRLPLGRAALAFACVLTVATAFSIRPRISLWGSYERQQGLVTLLAYPLLFLLTVPHLRTRAQLERLWTGLVWGSAPVVAYGLLQAAGLGGFAWRTDASPILSTMGRSNFLASYLVLVMPLTAARFLLGQGQAAHAGLLAAQGACLALTGVRAAPLGLAAGALVGFGAWKLAAGHRRAAVLATLTLLVGGGLGLLVLYTSQGGSVAARLTIWRTALSLVPERPWLGYGPETLRPLFLGHFPPELVYYQGREVVVDRAHNLWLDLALNAGIVGVGAFATLLWGFARLAWRGLRGGRKEGILWAALVAACVGHLVDLQFTFEVTATATVFWLALALGAALSRPPGTARGAPPRIPILTYAPAALGTLFLVATLSIRPLWADGACHAAEGAGGYAVRVEAAGRAVRAWPIEPEYWLRRAWLLAEGGRHAEALASLTEAQRLDPADPRLSLAEGTLHLAWEGEAPQALAKAEEAFRTASSLAPDVAGYRAALGSALAHQGRWAEALVEVERAVALDATDGEAYRLLARIYAAMGRETAARWAWQQANRWSQAMVVHERTEEPAPSRGHPSAD